MLDPFVHLLYAVVAPLARHVPAAALVVALTLLTRLALHPLMRRPGLLTALAQAPVFATIYRLFTTPVIAGQQNLLLDQSLLGVPMSGHLLVVGVPGIFVLGVVLALIVAVAWLTVLDTRTHLPELALPAGQPPEVAAVAERMRRVTPYLSLGSVLFAAFMPLAAMLYLLTSSTWSLLERRHLRAAAAL
ncbi:hypothetical protein EFY87_13690 [Flexivirga caeni]|uniref:YidC/Oxa1 family membrane protein insertase n=1 Tax=Flexivirga caeni TaxID=2294115 RepID=A0A3M9M511_9MICO|nr:hypothetical protein EFY87_13690 [Flexivirga caeni]